MKKEMKKTFCLLAMLFIMITLFCILPIFKVNISGIENFQRADSTFGLCQQLFPSDKFLNEFPYVDGDYHYYFNGSLGFGKAVAFSVLEYSPETYKAAKEFCFQEFKSTDIHQYRVGEYFFIEHLWDTSKNAEGEWELKCKFPEIFNMFAYNDSLCTLIFIGYYEDDFDSDVQWTSAVFEEFYKDQFEKYYVLEGTEE